MVVGGNISWEKIFGLAMTAAKRDGLCFWRRESAIRILQILTTKQYPCSVSPSLRLKEESLTGEKCLSLGRRPAARGPEEGLM